MATVASVCVGAWLCVCVCAWVPACGCRRRRAGSFTLLHFMLKATLAAAVFSFILQLPPPPPPPPATPSPLLPIFAFFCFLLTSQLSHIKNANNLLALYANRAQARESARA